MKPTEYALIQRLRRVWDPMWGNAAKPAPCAHPWEWGTVTRCDLDAPSPWAGGRRYLRQTCPRCCQWVSTKRLPTSRLLEGALSPAAEQVAQVYRIGAAGQQNATQAPLGAK